MLRREDIRAAMKSHQQAALRALLGLVAIMAGACLLAWFSAIIRTGQVTGPWNHWELALAFCSSFASVAYFLYAVTVSEQRLPNCPHCHKREPRSMVWWLSTGKCPKCGETVCELVEGRTTPQFGPSLRLADYRQARETLRRRSILFLPGLFVACYGCFLVPYLVGFIRGRPWWAHRDHVEAAWMLLAAFGLIAIGFGGMTWAYRRFPKCPNCRTSLIEQGGLLIATRNCVQCGGRVFDPRDDAPKISGPMISVTTMEQNDRATVRQFYVRMGVGVAWMILVMILGMVLCGPPPLALPWSVWVPMLAVIGLIAPQIWLLVALHRIRSRNEYACPHCQHPLANQSNLLRATGCCGHCGGRVHVV